jgi:4-hydroxy-3-methylbut-2-enyl diphosphate reductase IspH
MASELTPAQEREYVESKWEQVHEQIQHRVREAPRDWHGYVLVVRDRHEELIASGNKVERWHAAFIYTQERERQIAQLEEQRRVQDGFMSICTSTDRETMKRTTALLQRELEQAKRGWKEQ